MSSKFPSGFQQTTEFSQDWKSENNISFGYSRNIRPSRKKVAWFSQIEPHPTEKNALKSVSCLNSKQEMVKGSRVTQEESTHPPYLKVPYFQKF